MSPVTEITMTLLIDHMTLVTALWQMTAFIVVGIVTKKYPYICEQSQIFHISPVSQKF